MQRIVITSSTEAVMSRPLSKPTVLSEQDWNSSAIKEVQEMGNKCRPASAYCASKNLAEKGGILNIIFFFCNQLPGIFMSSISPRLDGI